MVYFERIMETKKNQKRIKNRRLLVQVGLMFLAVFSVLLVCLGFLLVRHARESFLSGLQDTMRGEMRQIQGMIADKELFDWMTEYWEKYPQEIKSMEDIGELEVIYDSPYITNMGDLKEGAKIEDLDKEDLSYRLAVARVCTDALVSEMMVATSMSKNYSMLLDFRKDRRGTVYLRIPFENTPLEGIGMQMPELFVDEEVDELLSSNTHGKNEQYFTDYVDEDGNNVYIGYAPIYSHGEPRFVLVYFHDWTENHKEQLERTLWMLASIFVILVIGGALLLLFISWATVGPVKRLRYGVRKYAKEKKPEELQTDMAVVRNRNELGELAGDISEMAEEIDSYMRENIRLAGEREAAAAELSIAARVQHGQLPAEYPDSPYFTLRAFIRTAREVGGDFYDYFLLDDTHLLILIADVSDKGMNAAFFMGIAKAMIKSWAMKTKDPVEIITEAEKMLSDNNPDGLFVTAWLAVIDLATGHVDVCNAGHDHPLIRKDGEYTVEKTEHGPAMAFLPGVPHVGSSFDLAPGDRIFLYTDGILEAADSNKERFGVTRLLTTLNEAPAEATDEELIDCVRTAVDDFAGDAPQFDDITMLSFTFIGR